MCLLREEVKSITIVEIHKDIIDNFERNILPQYNIDKPVNIIHGDAFDYYNDEFMRDYEHVFVDIWLNNTDGLEIYEQLMKVNVKHSNIDYWIEDAITLEIRRYIALYLLMWNRGDSGKVLRVYPEKDVERYYKAINRIFKTIDGVIDTEEKVLEYINNDELIKRVFIEA